MLDDYTQGPGQCFLNVHMHTDLLGACLHADSDSVGWGDGAMWPEILHFCTFLRPTRITGLQTVL